MDSRGADAAPIVIVGTGPVGMRAAQVLLQLEPSLPLLLFGGEPCEPYNRVRLTSVLAGEAPYHTLDNRLALPLHHRVVQHHNRKIISIDRARHTITDAHGQIHRYAKLILATGSRPVIPSIPGVTLEGVHTFRDRADLDQLLNRRGVSRRAVVIGGGLLGLETARALHGGNTQVVVIEAAPRLLQRQLDEEAAGLVLEHLRSLGIRVSLGQGIHGIVGSHAVKGVVLPDHELVPCDTVVLATGIRPVTDLASAAGLSVARGVQVNDDMCTSDPDIFAIGECAEHRGRVHGLVGPGLEQAEVAARRVLGRQAEYTGSAEAATLKVVGLPVFSLNAAIAENGDPSGRRELRYASAVTGQYWRIFLENGRLVGAIGVGPWEEKCRVHEAILQRRRIWPWQRLRFRWTGRLLWSKETQQSVVHWPAVATVCHCAAVSRGTLDAALSRGAITVEALAACTGASTVCGSCRPLLCELVGALARQEPAEGYRALIGLSLAVCLGALWFALAPPVDFSETVQGIWHLIDALWRDNVLKQISGYSLLTAVLLTLSLSLRKRWQRVRFGDFASWRVAHIILGLLALLLLVAHTGFRLGENLNFMLMVSFLAVSLSGAAMAGLVAVEHRLDRAVARRLRSGCAWLHLLMLWPLPVLLVFHIVSVYYF